MSARSNGTSSSLRKRSTTRRKKLKERPELLKKLAKHLKLPMLLNPRPRLRLLKLKRSESVLLSAVIFVKTESASV